MDYCLKTYHYLSCIVMQFQEDIKEHVLLTSIKLTIRIRIRIRIRERERERERENVSTSVILFGVVPHKNSLFPPFSPVPNTDKEKDQVPRGHVVETVYLPVANMLLCYFFLYHCRGSCVVLEATNVPLLTNLN